jgi:hypothetical protein
MHGAFVASHSCTEANNLKVKSQNSKHFSLLTLSIKVPNIEVSDTTGDDIVSCSLEKK